MGYPLSGYLYREFQLLDTREFMTDHEIYLVKPGGTYEVVDDVAEFLHREDPGLGADDGVWVVDRRARLFAFRIQTGDYDVVATVSAALADIRQAFGADVTDGVERLVHYFRRLPARGPTEEAAGGGKGVSDVIARDVYEEPPHLPGVSVLVELIQPYAEWATAATGELIEVDELGLADGNR